MPVLICNVATAEVNVAAQDGCRLLTLSNWKMARVYLHFQMRILGAQLIVPLLLQCCFTDTGREALRREMELSF